MAGTFYGELFYGVMKAHLRQSTHSILVAHKYDKVINLCSGSFNIAKVAVAAGYRPEQIFCSDKSLYSTILGYIFSGQRLSSIPGLKMAEDIAAEFEKASDEFAKASILLYEMRLSNLRKIDYRKNIVEDMVARRDYYISQYDEKLKKEYEVLSGLNYKIADIHDEFHDYGDNDILIAFLPTDKGGYEKAFDYGDRIDIEMEDSSMFNPDEFPELFNRSIGWKTHYLTFTHTLYPEIDRAYNFSAKYNGHGVYDWFYSNKVELIPETVKGRMDIGKHKSFTPIKGVSMWGAKEKVTEDTKIQVLPIKAEHGLYYRGLWIHNMGPTNADVNYGIFLDGKIAGVFGYVGTGNLSKLMSDYIFLLYTSMIHSDVYSNFVRLLERCATSTAMKKILYKDISGVNRYYSLKGVKTKSLTKHKTVRASKGIFKTVEKSFDKKQNVNVFTDYAAFRNETFEDCLRDYIKEAKIRKEYR